jgi:hypothetical protein
MAGAGVGSSRSEDAWLAGREAAEQARAQAGGPPGFVLVYGTVIYDQEQLLAGVRSVVGEEVPVAGCSTQGISRNGAVEEVDRVVGVAMVAAPGVRARTARVLDFAADPRAAGRSLAEQIGPVEPGACPLLVWYDPLTGADVHELLTGLAERGRTQVLGGAAGQPWGPVYRTFQYLGGEVTGGSAVALQIDGPVDLMYELTHGTEPLGLEMTVTASDGVLVREIDGLPALQVWVEHMGAGLSSATAVSLALGVTLSEVEPLYEGPITRAVMGLREEEQALVLQAPIPAGTTVQLCHRTQQAVHDRALEMGRRLHRRLEGREPMLALSFECGARPRPFLGDAGASQEVCAIQQILGEQVPWLGLYPWGELAPVGDKTYFHNYTFPLAVLVGRG